MEFKQIESFVAVVQKKSFSKAADMLFVSQPTITGNVQKLEKELGVILLNRKNKNITLTDGGKVFYAHAVELINVCAQAKYSISEYKKNIEGVLEIYASSIPEQHLLPYIIKAFKDIYPLVRFSVWHKDSRTVVDDILAGSINFGFIGAKQAAPNLEYVDFYDDKLVLIAAPTKKFNADIICVTDLLDEDIILREDGSGTRLLLEKALATKKLDLSMFRSQSINDSLEAIKKMVSLDIGISFISSIAVQNEVALGQLKQYEVEDLVLSRPFSMVYSTNRCLSPVEEKFKDFVVNWRWNAETVNNNISLGTRQDWIT